MNKLRETLASLGHNTDWADKTLTLVANAIDAEVTQTVLSRAFLLETGELNAIEQQPDIAMARSIANWLREDVTP